MKMYNFHADPGHGWLEVTKAELNQLDIANKITPYSYMQGSIAYLEEDCDLSTFMRAKEEAGQPLTSANFRELYKDNTPIRNYDSYKADQFIQKDAFAGLFVNETMAAYRAGSHYIEAVIDNGHSRYGGVSVKQFISDGFEIMTLDEATARIDDVLSEMFNKPWFETTEEDYCSMMGVLPPENYQGGNFRMSEFDIGTFTRHYLCTGGRYYTAIRKARPEWDTYERELQQQLNQVRDEVNSEEAAQYKVDTTKYVTKPKDIPINDCYMIDCPEFNSWEEAEDECIRQAKLALKRRMRKHGVELTSPVSVADFLHLELEQEEQEIFCGVFLDTRHRLIEFKRMFYGTIDGASVHPREVVKEALKLNAAAVIFAHNHPSGNPEPSNADITITARLKSALALVDVRVLDHLVIGNFDHVSLAQRGNI